MRHRFSRQQSSFTARMRNLRDTPNVSDKKSNDQRWPGCSATGIGVRDPRARLRPLRRLNAQLFLGVNTLQLLVVHDYAFAFQQHADPATTEPTPFAGNRLHLFANFRIVRRMITPNSLWIDTDRPARPALRDIMIPHCLACRSPSHIRCLQFFLSKSFRTTLSSIVSAKRRFSLAFSSSSDLRRWCQKRSCHHTWLRTCRMTPD